MSKDKINWSPIGGQAPTGEDFGVAPDIEVDKPAVTERISEEGISSAAKSGQKTRNVNYWDRIKETGQSAINPLAMALLGAVRSLPALSKAEGYTNPLIPLIVGSGAGLQARQDTQGEERARQIAEQGNQKMEDRFPDFVAQNPWSKGMTVNEFKQNGSTFAAIEKQNKPKISVGTAAQLQKLRPDLNDEQIYSLDEATAAKYVLEFTKEGGRNDRARDIMGASNENPDVITNEETGIKFVRSKTRSGVRWVPIPGQTLTDTERSRIPLAREAIREADKLIEWINDDRSTELLKANNSYKKLASVNDPLAQKMAKSMFKVADARARIMTGAQINEYEMDKYYNDLVNWMNTKEGNINSLNVEKDYFNDYLNLLSKNRAMPGGGEAPSPSNKNEVSAW